jgi:hypothetical protein
LSTSIPQKTATLRRSPVFTEERLATHYSIKDL